MSLAAIEELLKNTMGLDAHTIGVSSIHRAAQQRMGACGHGDDATAYFQLLRASKAELEALIEAVVVPETWFFRDQRPFDALKRFVQEEWLPNHFAQQLRILSVPCSSGEEAYSIAMALCDLGFPEAKLHIDAVDISRENLVRAQRAQYRNNSFRGQKLGFRQRYFTPVGDEYLLEERIRRQVNFQQANLLDASFLHMAEPYDIVFCRNLLIYFNRPTQDRALQILRRLLKDDGVLFIGHAEAGLFLQNWKVSNRYPSAFAFRKSNDERRAVERPDFSLPRRRQKPKSVLNKSARPPVARATTYSAAPAKQATPAPAPTADATLKEALHLANHGHLAEAADLCEQQLRLHGPSAQAYYLLGLVREATGLSEEAEGFWRKAIYLDPKHVEALTHLALLCERNGDDKAAQLLYRRAKRAAPDTGSSTL